VGLRPTITLLAATLLVGCSLLRPAEPPRVSLVDPAPLASASSAERQTVHLRVQNPRRAPLQVRGISCRVDVNGEELGRGTRTEPFSVPGRGEGVVDVDLVVDRMQRTMKGQALDPLSPGVLTYRLTGELDLGGTRLRFEQDGELRPTGGKR
jgi:LEA14-like dessication related protein